MKQGTNNRRSRSRGGGGKRQYGGGRNSFESNGPDVKIRGTAQQIQDKYLSLARDASSSGDWVSAEAYFQFAEHYHRIISSNASNGAGKNLSQGQNKNQNEGRNSGKNPTQDSVSQETSVVQPELKNNLEKTTEVTQEDEVEVIDTSPAALAAAVAEQENVEVENSAEPEPEVTPKKAVS